MAAYRSPENPNITIIPPKKKTQAELNEAIQRELKKSELHGELMELYQLIPQLESRIDAVNRILLLIEQERNTLQDEHDRAEKRKQELEKLFKG